MSELPQLLFNPGDDCILLEHCQLVVDDHLPFWLGTVLGRCLPDKLVFGTCTHMQNAHLHSYLTRYCYPAHLSGVDYRSNPRISSPSLLQSARSLYWLLRGYAHDMGGPGTPILTCWRSLEKGVCLPNCWFFQVVGALCCDPLLLVSAHSWWAIFLYPLISATCCFLQLLTPFELVVRVPWWMTENDWQVSSLPDDHRAGVLPALLLHLLFNQNAEYANTKLAVWLLPSCFLQKW